MEACTSRKKPSVISPHLKEWGRGSKCLPSVIQFVYILCTCTSTQGVNLLSAVYWCLIQKMIVFPILVFFFFFFLVNYVKVLELYWLLTILKQQNKTIWIVLQRMTLFRDGTKLSSILFIPLNDFGAGTWDFLIYSMILHICSSQHEHEAQWHQVAE